MFLGEVAERPKAQHWKCCVGVTLPRVQIPPSPLESSQIGACVVMTQALSIFEDLLGFGLANLLWARAPSDESLGPSRCRSWLVGVTAFAGADRPGGACLVGLAIDVPRHWL